MQGNGAPPDTLSGFIKRLRDRSQFMSAIDPCTLLIEAADRIEELESKVKSLEAKLETTISVGFGVNDGVIDAIMRSAAKGAGE